MAVGLDRNPHFLLRELTLIDCFFNQRKEYYWFKSEKLFIKTQEHLKPSKLINIRKQFKER